MINIKTLETLRQASEGLWDRLSPARMRRVMRDPGLSVGMGPRALFGADGRGVHFRLIRCTLLQVELAKSVPGVLTTAHPHATADGDIINVKNTVR